ncbi:FKBP-type peptidyl-prolyl cis-trans isomerase [Sunxiuqinia elliptica]|uniref:Peptidyl-prolyl cis-trans isomerase n=1 Tax=Sunxiuqinia elliptica TaxID=655355 RepID=A0A4R6HBS3_9BACT|nr:FKBP-type peptidyl-prolyl cis-trans isomerase [Sunxiuqinia elliptica]TDO05614.1 FKBP-type peptidyl-prolyl cis-trans isomerase FklB [Sunxiuqinia elliptica]TDO65158.1 FKBP-type peptidyl-prolyl cis-trans isomerase FklB [Sunxiuqinia elliptica]
MSDHKFSGELEEFSYALGLSIASNLIQSGVKTIEPSNFMLALEDIFTGKEPRLTPEMANKILQAFMEKQQSGEGKVNLEEGLKFLAENREKEGIIETASGLQYQVLEEGEGEKPSPSDQVKCHYHGTLIDGTVFDSSVQRGEPATFPVNGVIQGWVEALQMMTTGSKWRLYVPSDLAYGDRGAGGAIGPNTTLIFEVELLEIV